VIAPYNGSAAVGMGVLTAEFDKDPMFPFRWNPEYYHQYFVDLGYAPTYPLWYYVIDFSSEKYRAAERRVAENNAVVIRQLDKKQWDRDIDLFVQMMNATFKDEWEFSPVTSDEMHEFFDPMKPLLDPKRMLFGEVDGRPAGWCMGMPDWNPLFRTLKGKMGPVQMAKFMMKAGRFDRAGLLGIGVLPEYKGNGLAQALAVNLYRGFEERGLKEGLYYLVNEANTRSRKFAESMGGTGRAVYHVYDKRVGG
jgi:hypothetical protein